jgi:hypothetical protein
VAPVFEEVSAHNAALVEVAVAFVPVTIEIVIPIGAVV